MLEELYVSAFHEFDSGGTGLVKGEDFKKYMATYGEKLQGVWVRFP